MSDVRRAAAMQRLMFWVACEAWAQGPWPGRYAVLGQMLARRPMAPVLTWRDGAEAIAWNRGYARGRQSRRDGTTEHDAYVRGFEHGVAYEQAERRRVEDEHEDAEAISMAEFEAMRARLEAEWPYSYECRWCGA